MNSRPNPTLIGAFVVAALFLAVGALVVFGGGEMFADKHEYVVHFEGSLDGLSVGAPVLWRGVEIGSVTDFAVSCDLQTKSLRTPVYIETIRGRIREASDQHDPLTGDTLQMLIDNGLRASLVMRSLVTGQLAIQLDFHPGTPVRLVGGDPGYVEIPTVESGLSKLAKRLEDLEIDDLVKDARHAIQGVDELVRSEDLKNAIRSIKRMFDEYRALGQTLNRRADPLLDNVEAAVKSSKGTFDQARTSLRRAEETITNVETHLTSALDQWSKLAANLDTRVEPLSKDLQKTMTQARDALVQARATFATIDGLLKDDAPSVSNLNRALTEIADAARALRSLARTLARQPESLLRGKKGTK